MGMVNDLVEELQETVGKALSILAWPFFYARG
jgi:hypothetical protein